jgi:hypothetical protein
LVDDVLMNKKENEERRKVLRYLEEGGVCSFLFNCRSCHLVAETIVAVA